MKRLQAHLDGYDTPRRDGAIASADVIVTVTGRSGVLGPEDLGLFKDGVVIANAGHFPVEVDAAQNSGAVAHFAARRRSDC